MRLLEDHLRPLWAKGSDDAEARRELAQLRCLAGLVPEAADFWAKLHCFDARFVTELELETENLAGEMRQAQHNGALRRAAQQLEENNARLRAHPFASGRPQARLTSP